MKIAFQTMISPYTYEDTDTIINMAEAAVNKGHEVAIFLFADSVLAINGAVKPLKIDRDIPKKMGDLIQKGVEVHICGICFQYRGLDREEIIPGAKLSGLPELASIIAEYDRFVSLSA